MDQERWRKIEELYQSALEREPGQRGAFLADVCPDKTLRREVESLLRCEPRGDQLLEKPPPWEIAFGPLEPGSRLGHYRIERRIGVGGMGEVYRAHDTKLARDVAIKVLPRALARDVDRVARFKREAHLLASLNHPHIAAIHGIDEADGQTFLVLELVEGETLAERIRRGALPVDETLDVCGQIAEALEAAHDNRIIHRDLKPANIKITPAGQVKVLDFGLAKALEEDPTTNDLSNSPTVTDPLTRRGVILGTAAYMSPEQAKGNDVDKRTDVWAFGCVMFECLTAKRAFEGETVTEVLAAILSGEPDWSALSASTPEKVTDLLHSCLQKAHKDRLHDIGDARIAITRMQAGVPERPASVTSTPADGRSLWLARALPWALAGLLGVALVAKLLLSPNSESVPAVSSRTSLLLSPDNSLTVDEGPAISPDGSTVAFVASSTAGSRRLYVRRLDEWEPRPLPLTEGVYHPFFSADGQWIAFSRGEVTLNLERVPLAGGAPQVICNTTGQANGGRWQSNGAIVFGTWPAGLWRVASDGSAPRLIIQPTERSSYSWPEPLPDSRGILFTISKAGRNSVAILAPGADTPRILVESGARPRYLPTGHLVYVAEGHLFAVPFDLERLEVRAGAAIVVDDVSQGQLNSLYDVSMNGLLVYLPTVSPSLGIVWRDRRGVSTPISTEPREYAHPALSSDGMRLSVSVLEGPSRNIWTGSVASGLLTRLTFGNNDGFGLWSRDGKLLFYSTAGHIFSTTTDGSGKVDRVTQSSNPQRATSVSPNGDTLLFNDIDPSTNVDIWEISLVDKKARPVVKTRFIEAHAVFSPDGHWIAFESNETGRFEVYVQAYPGPGGKHRVSPGGGEFPAWSHTGRELFYQTDTGMFSVPVLDTRDLRVGPPQRLFSKTPTTLRQSFSAVDADDQRFLMVEAVASKQPPQFNVMHNWFEELQRRVPLRR